MNKNIKKIIALILTMNSISAISPTALNTYFIGIKPVYAASYSPSDGELKSLKIKSLNGETVNLLDEYYGSTVKLSEDKEYYARLTDDSDGIKISAESEGDGYIVKIFTSDAADATAYDPGDEILLGKGDTTLYVRTYESKSAFIKAKNTDKDVSNCEEEYTVNLKKTTESSYEDSSQDPIYLDKLDLSKGDLSFVKEKTNYDVTVTDDIDSMWIKAIPKSSSNRVRINGSLIDSSDNYKKVVSLNEGKNQFKIKVTDDNDNQRTYTVNITRGDASNTQDDIYLDNLTISEGTLDFLKDESAYNVDLDQSVNAVTIGAVPEDEGYLVTINGNQVKSDNDYEKKVSLDNGKNVINVTVQDEVNDKKRTYTLTINRGQANSSQNTSDTSNTTSTSSTTGAMDTSDKKSQWVQTADGWRYYDENGKMLKNEWFYDKDQKVYCYLDKDGLRVTGWFKDKDKWYLLDEKGAMLTGWQYSGSKWYLLGIDGAMIAGWYKEDATAQNSTNTDSNTSTSAETNTTTSNSNNASTQTEKWYYLNADGTMKTGWLLDNGKWYFFNSDGTMQKGWLIDYNSKYYLTEDGTMATGTKTINGKVYRFTDGGVLII
jgi:glucan-binding YG repeat protein